MESTERYLHQAVLWTPPSWGRAAKADDIEIRAYVSSVRSVFGRAELYIMTDDGEGGRWVNVESVRLASA